MPQLPTFTVTDAQAERLLAAFGSADGYKKWLKQSIIGMVMQHEGRELDAEVAEKKRVINQELEIDLTGQ